MANEKKTFSVDFTGWLRKKSEDKFLKKNSGEMAVQVKLLKQFNNQTILIRKLSEQSLTYDTKKKQYVDRQNRRISKKAAFDVGSVTFAKPKQAKETQTKPAITPTKIATGLGVAAIVALYGPMMWPFVKGLLSELLPSFITEAAKNVSEVANKFIGFFTKGGPIDKSIQWFSESTDEVLKFVSDLNPFTKKDDIQSGVDKLEQELEKSPDDLLNVVDEKQTKQIKDAQKTIDDASKDFSDEKPSAAVTPPSKKPEQEKQAAPKAQPAPIPPVSVAPTPQQEKTTEPPTKTPAPALEEKKPKRGSLAAARRQTAKQPTAEQKPKAAQTATPAAPSVAKEKQQDNKTLVKDQSIQSSMSDDANKTQTSGPKKITSPYGERPNPFNGTKQFHPGIDVGGGQGVPIAVTVPVKVLSVRDDPRGYGYFFDVNFPDGTLGRFAHMSKINVKAGEKIDGDTIVGLMGGAKGQPGSGSSTGPHLHFEHRYKMTFGGNPSDSIDPMKSAINYIAIGTEISNKSNAVTAEKKKPVTKNVVVGVSTTKTAGLQQNG